MKSLHSTYSPKKNHPPFFSEQETIAELLNQGQLGFVNLKALYLSYFRGSQMKSFFPRSILLFVLAFAFASHANATHNRAGEIIYEHIDGFTYKVTIITCTKASALADRPYLPIRWGDEPSNTPTTSLDSLARVVEVYLSGMDAKRNEYIGYHTYTGPGVFEISMGDPNRNSGILNIANSVQAIFAIRSILVISPETGHNNSVVLLNPPKEQACINQPWIHNPAAYDPDGDSLVYSLVPCLGTDPDGNLVTLQDWVPPQVWTLDPTDVFLIDSQTGDVTWNVPPVAGEYNIAILIQEFRNGIFVGSVLRDMQIDVINCSNQPPIINPLPDYCVEAGDFLQFHVVAFDPDGNDISIVAYGGPLTQVVNEAEWNSFTDNFSWSPECSEVRNQPYSVSFQATDNGFVPLSDIESVNIRVVAPRVENPNAIAANNTISLTWDVSPCANIFTEYTATQVRYKIYRRTGLYGFTPDVCELGVPDYTGYQYIGEVQGLNNTSYVDNNVFYGGTYCYMVVTCFPDGALSYASEEFCATVQKDVPVITKVSIGLTNISSGVDTVWWSPPSELDTLVFTGPYQYKLYHSEGFLSPNDLIYESSISPFLIWSDTTFIHENINTQSTAHSYKVEFYSNGELVTVSSKASSPFVQLVPNDNQIEVNVLGDVPWTNYLFHIYRKGPGESVFTEIATTETPTYLDDSLQNNQLYCYKVFAIGTYNAQLVPDPLFNWSQEACAQPYDQTPPCAPQLMVEGNCSDEFDLVSWTNPNYSCATDVTGYNLYYTPIEGGTFELLATFNLGEDTTYIFNEDGAMNSIAGCFAVTALDSLNIWPDGLLHQNESPFSNIICVDNCPVYFLPNIFTPNGDGTNDLYVPFDYRFVKDIDLKVYNRWGTVVFETTNPDVLWDGKNKDSGLISTDGAYYYTITVNTIRLVGIVPEKFSGAVQIQDGKQPLSGQ